MERTMGRPTERRIRFQLPASPSSSRTATSVTVTVIPKSTTRIIFSALLTVFRTLLLVAILARVIDLTVARPTPVSPPSTLVPVSASATASQPSASSLREDALGVVDAKDTTLLGSFVSSSSPLDSNQESGSLPVATFSDALSKLSPFSQANVPPPSDDSTCSEVVCPSKLSTFSDASQDSESDETRRASLPFRVNFKPPTDSFTSHQTFADFERQRARDFVRLAKLLLAGPPNPQPEADNASKMMNARADSKNNGAGTTAVLSNAIVTYTASVGVGKPPVNYTLLIDTGSSNTWLGADPEHPYVRSSTSYATSDTVGVTYGSGSFKGKEYIDTLTLSPTLIIRNQSIGVADSSMGFDGVDGILGVGPLGLTKKTLFPSVDKDIPTVTDNLYRQGTIKNASIGVFFHPTSYSTTPSSNPPGYPQDGELTFGDVDNSKLLAQVQYAPITKASPASVYWGIDQTIRYGGTQPTSSTSSRGDASTHGGLPSLQSVDAAAPGGNVTGGSGTLILSKTAGIVDTGTTLTLIATDAFNAYMNLTGGILDKNNTGLLKLDQEGYRKLKSLWFIVGPNAYELIPNAQIFPRALNEAIGGERDAYYSIIADIGAPSGGGLDFINGYSFLQRYYSVYDTGGKRVGFAPTLFTRSQSN